MQDHSGAIRDWAVGLMSIGCLGLFLVGCVERAPVPAPRVAPRPNPLAGREFRVKPGGDPTAMIAEVKAAAAQGKGLPAGIEELDKAGKPLPKKSPVSKAASADKDAERLLEAKIRTQVTEMYGLIAGKPVDIVEMQKVSGMFRVIFGVRGDKGPNSTVHISGDGKLIFEGGVELKRRYEEVQSDHNFAQCLHLKGLRIVGDLREKTSQAQIKEVGSFGGLVLVDCGRAPENCKKLGLKKLPAILHGEDSFTGPRPRAFLETLTGCK